MTIITHTGERWTFKRGKVFSPSGVFNARNEQEAIEKLIQHGFARCYQCSSVNHPMTLDENNHVVCYLCKE